MSKDDGNGKKWALGAVIAGVVGFFAGILTAPKSGKETRQDIKDAASSALRAVEKQLKNVHTELNDLIGEAQSKVGDMTAKGKKEVENLMADAKKARNQVKEMLSALHEGDAEDPELKKALKNAQAAKAHLGKYLKK